jgi:hypothetical protein
VRWRFKGRYGRRARIKREIKRNKMCSSRGGEAVVKKVSKDYKLSGARKIPINVSGSSKRARDSIRLMDLPRKSGTGAGSVIGCVHLTGWTRRARSPPPSPYRQPTPSHPTRHRANTTEQERSAGVEQTAIESRR